MTPGARHDPPIPSPAHAAEPTERSLTLSAGKRDLVIRTPFTNAAGFLGCNGAARESIEFAALGAYITPPLSLQPRSPAGGPRLLPFPGGFLLHTGHPNPGLSAAIRHNRRHWAGLPCPVIVHLLAHGPEDARQAVRWIESVDVVAGLEIGLGEVDAHQAALVVAASTGEMPLIAHLPLGTAASVFVAAAEAGAQAVSIGAPRGALPGPDGTLVRGRLIGPAVFPIALRAVAQLAEQLRVPILAGGGVYRREQAVALLRAGAAVVQLDGVLWTTPERVLPGLRREGG
jgi:dihydroorotate dehydrogenase (NAD+) catalytic subunit